MNKFLLFLTLESKYTRIGTKARAGHLGDTDINHDPANPISEVEPLSQALQLINTDKMTYD